MSERDRKGRKEEEHGRKVPRTLPSSAARAGEEFVDDWPGWTGQADGKGCPSSGLASAQPHGSRGPEGHGASAPWLPDPPRLPSAPALLQRHGRALPVTRGLGLGLELSTGLAGRS